MPEAPSCPALFLGSPPCGRIHLCQLLPPPTSSSSAQGSLTVSGRPGVESELWPAGHAGRAHPGPAGDAHLETWPSCLGGTCGTRCCSWCRCGEDTSRPTGRRSGTGDTEKSTYAGARGGVRRHPWQSAEPNAGADGPSPAGVNEPDSRGEPTRKCEKTFHLLLGATTATVTSLLSCPQHPQKSRDACGAVLLRGHRGDVLPRGPGPEGQTAGLREPTSRCVRLPQSCSCTSHSGL